MDHNHPKLPNMSATGRPRLLQMRHNCLKCAKIAANAPQSSQIVTKAADGSKFICFVTTLSTLARLPPNTALYWFNKIYKIQKCSKMNFLWLRQGKHTKVLKKKKLFPGQLGSRRMGRKRSVERKYPYFDINPFTSSANFGGFCWDFWVARENSRL